MSEEEKVVLEEQPVEAAETVEEPVVQEESMDLFVYDPEAPVITLKKLLQAGVHFGHLTKRWNPKMKPYIYGPRNNIYIIDLTKTAEKLAEAYDALKAIAAENGKVLFVGTKKQINECVAEEANRSGSFYVNNRWLGGTLTNFGCIQRRIKYLRDLENDDEMGVFLSKSKKELAAIRKEMEKLRKNLDGIKEMRKLPDAMVVVDPTVEYNAIREAKILNIPVFALVDTNGDPDNIDHVIPANDDASKSVKLLLSVLADAVVEGKGGQPMVAHAKVTEEDVTMTDAIKQVDKENEARIAAIREQKRIRKEAYERQIAERDAKKQQNGEKQNRKPRAPRAPKAENAEGEQPAEAAATEAKPVRKPRAPKAPKAEAPVVEEVKAEEPKAEEVKGE